MSFSQYRERYARAVAAAPGVDDPRVVEAFKKVPREHFVGPGPWLILAREGYVGSETSDPAVLYDDIVVALAPDRRINNGQPTLHARCLSAARVRPGERILHIGCGSGYYSAVLSELVTPSGHVVAWDLEADLTARARSNLVEWTNVAVDRRDGTVMPIPRSNVIYVCAGCTAPLRAWVDALADGGRLVFPLTPGWDFGGMLMITRTGDDLAARFVCRCSFIPCVGGSDEIGKAAVQKAFSTGNMDDVSSLHFGFQDAGSGTWLAGDGWWLSTTSQSRRTDLPSQD